MTMVDKLYGGGTRQQDNLHKPLAEAPQNKQSRQTRRGALYNLVPNYPLLGDV